MQFQNEGSIEELQCLQAYRNKFSEKIKAARRSAHNKQPSSL